MPRGKELEQLPMSTVAPGAGKDRGPFARDSLTGINGNEQPRPSSIKGGKTGK
ncbi:hypothetical protein [Neobacillus notoginsengisoli]|uniref:hypothetical protein n=1 Tax=Neobacillus notoginsengisoli TaxID=1578198 RepID=UPI001864FA70|nr:hypothetical protein [Neobacillus notoginsengisoli]